MKILLNSLSSFVLLIGLVWALLPGGFGLRNFKKKHAQPLAAIASVSWGLLILANPLVCYWVWFAPGGAYGWLAVLLVLHILFLSVFARDLSTS